MLIARSVCYDWSTLSGLLLSSSDLSLVKRRGKLNVWILTFCTCHVLGTGHSYPWILKSFVRSARSQNHTSYHCFGNLITLNGLHNLLLTNVFSCLRDLLTIQSKTFEGHRKEKTELILVNFVEIVQSVIILEPVWTRFVKGFCDKVVVAVCV